MQLILQICMVAQLSTCKEEKIMVSVEEITPMQCMITALQEIAKWSESHPKWKVESWICARPKKEFKI